MTGTRKSGRIRPWIYFLLIWGLFAAGCSTSNDSSGLNLVDASGNHPSGFLATHPGIAVSDVSQCTSCHGSDLRGGISGTSCFTSACHHDTIPAWSQPAQHGASAKRAPGASGFKSCQICHGSDFSGGGSQVTCLTAACHGGAGNTPHPANWRSGDASVHTTTAEENASVCALCHTDGANSPIAPPSPPAPAGTPPGCFNSTLCHGASAAPHILGSTWTEPTSAAFHGLAAKQDLLFCQSCHGNPGTIQFNGGTAPTACSTCHTTAKAHPTTWYQDPVETFPGYVPSHQNALNKSTTCSICHDYTQGRTPPNPDAPSCFSASYGNTEHASVGCHSGGPGANHDVPFFDNTHFQATTATFTSNCSNCHVDAVTLPDASPPGCRVCHTAGSPLTQTGCASCHANPPNGGAGTAYPNIAGAHAVHLDLNNDGLTPVNCNTCHNGLGTNTLAHYNRANGRSGAGGRVSPGDAAFPTTYNAETGATSFDNVALSCSNVSCHGGTARKQGTPGTPLNWQNDTLDVNTECTSCHAFGTTQFNSYSSGRHDQPAHVLLGCLVCHNTTTLEVNHFTALSTPAMEGPASATVGGGVTFVTSYDAATGSCTSSCHNVRTWGP